MGEIEKCLKWGKDDMIYIMRDDIEIVKPFNKESLPEEIKKLKAEAQKKNKKLDDYIDELVYNKIRERLKIDIEEFIKLRATLLAKEAKDILRLYKNIVEFHHTDVVPFYNSIISKYPKIEGEFAIKNGVKSFSQKNFAIFKTKILKSSKELETVNELVHSSSIELYEDFINSYKKSDELLQVFKNGIVDYNGHGRAFDTEVKYIFNFLMKHLHKGDEFIIETTNIYYACSSCQREFVMFEEFLKTRGKKVKFIVHSDEEIKGSEQLYEQLIKNK
ncbi:hypothetical protein [uncultured Chryseobacterium sp.]|uniref:hypothetical protein n=1 Tax=uncultured Chryseobacterium sp. TaxID=259322 RepID=UPI0025870B5A|nr:hypothetical protein [uncultured Chryseobacterium sp.]